MKDLDDSKKKKIDDLIENAMRIFDPKNIEQTILILEEAWDILPAKKEDWKESFLISKYITHVYFNAEQYDNALVWAKKFNDSNPGRDYGESEFMLGKILVKKNETKKAKKYFEIADKKSDGRVWKGEKDMNYFKVYKSK
ncbi:hypothetical protein [uncultured Kriegella sp.]|uniref:hypothetical protein n=1 Tax=uncultured Kriegella sp. TaxID=1798910 RepID=UPI0030D840BC|tara:strand:+ start:364311 stop:364730 length:420 start_codon:yes stop_codon:yes gene_type:complete